MPSLQNAEGLAVTGTMVVTDVAGNSATFTTPPFKIDKTPPTVSSIVRASASPTNATTVNFTVTFTEAVTGVDMTDFTLTATGVSGAAVSSVSGTGGLYTVAVNTGTGSGTLRLDIDDNDTIVDLAGNKLGGTGVGNGNFNTGEAYTIDKAPPVVTITAPQNGASYKPAAVPQPAYTVADNLDPQPSVVVTGWSNAEGVQTMTITATDAAGNVGTATVKYTMDNTPPVIIINSPQAKDYLTSENLTINFSVTDALSGVANAEARLDGIIVTNGQVISLADKAGSHTFTVSATDKAGNSVAASVNFSVIMASTVDIDPNTLNLKSQSDKNAITAYIELPSGYDVGQINVATVKMMVNGTFIAAQLTPTSVGDYDGDKIPDRMVKFDRQAVIAALAGKTGDIKLTISGQFRDGRGFSGEDTIKVISPGK